MADEVLYSGDHDRAHPYLRDFDPNEAINGGYTDRYKKKKTKKKVK
jgi:hypothetical protein